MGSDPISAVRSPATSFLSVFSNPWLDRTIALIAMIPLLYLTYRRYLFLGLGIPLVSFAVGTLITFVTMIIRRPPKRVTPNPVYWLLTFVATYWAVLTVAVIQKGHPIVPRWTSDIVAIGSLLVIVWARLSLGRNIGFVPAQREIVTDGAYRYVRHPIYTGIFLGAIGVALRSLPAKSASTLDSVCGLMTRVYATVRTSQPACECHCLDAATNYPQPVVIPCQVLARWQVPCGPDVVGVRNRINGWTFRSSLYWPITFPLSGLIGVSLDESA